MLQQDVFHFGGRNVLTLPAIRIPQAVDELSMAEADTAQQVAGIEVAVALLEHIREHHLAVLFRVGVPVEG